MITGLNPATALAAAMATIVNDRVESYFGWTVESLKAPVPNNDYGIQWPDGTSQYFKEAHAYSVGGLDGHEKWWHMINMIKLDLPFFSFTNDGYINTEALRVIRSCVLYNDLGVAGAASSGKTFPIAAYILQDWKSAPNKTLTFVCTTTKEASEDRIWGAVVKLYQNSRNKVGTYVPHRYVIVYGKFSESAQDREMNAAIKALAIPKGKEGEAAIDTIRGRKQFRIRLVYDELPEMGLYVLRAAVNLEANDELQVIGIGNPMDHLDAHGQMLQPAHSLGWDSINKETPEWETRTGWAIFLNGEWSPNFQAPEGAKPPFPFLTHRVKLARMLKRCHGNKESLDYYRNAVGFWPDSTVSVTVLSLDVIKERKCEEKPKWRQTKRKRLCGLDTSFTLGGDLIVAQFGEVGEDMQGRMICGHLKEVVYMIPATGIFEEQLAKMVVHDCIEMGVEPDGFGMDISADGGKIMRAIIKYWLEFDRRAAEVVPLSSMEKPSERIVSNVDTRKCNDAFDRRVTEYWMMVREAVLCESVKGLTILENNTVRPMLMQLCTRTYSIKGKKFCLESKDDMKERTLGVSPDHADAFCYLIEMARRHGLILSSPQDDRRREEDEENREELPQNIDYNYQGNDWGEDEWYSIAA